MRGYAQRRYAENPSQILQPATVGRCPEQCARFSRICVHSAGRNECTAAEAEAPCSWSVNHCTSVHRLAVDICAREVVRLYVSTRTRFQVGNGK
jgi:hypothetical protein